MSGAFNYVAGGLSYIAGAAQTLATNLSIITGQSPVILDSVAFSGFEVPEKITWGGAQRLTVHRLPGGERIIDAMGVDPRPIEWSGIFLGPSATARAVQVDALRYAGAPVSLIWGDFVFTVIVASFEADTKFSQVPYRISCTVLADGSSQTPQTPDLLSSVGNDLGLASSVLSTVQSTIATVATAAGALGIASPALARIQGELTSAEVLTSQGATLAYGAAATVSALGALNTASTDINATLTNVGAALPAGITGVTGLSAAVVNANVSAGLAQARGFVGRSIANVTTGAP